MTADTKNNLDKWYLGHWVFLFVIIVITFLAYSNVLHGEPQFDDKGIFTTPLLQSPHAFKDLNLWEAFKGGLRPVTSFTFSLNYYFWGKDTLSYHLTNIFIHIINGILVYLLIYITLTLPSKSSHTPQKGQPHRVAPTLTLPWGTKGDFTTERWTAFLTALLFSLHPIQTESVSYIYQRAESLSSLFYLVSFISFIIAVRQSEVKGFTTSIICYLIFILGFLLALGSKEIAITLPATAFLYGIFFFEKKGLWRKVAIPGLLILAGLIVAGVRLITLREDPSAGYYLKEFTAWEYLLTQFSAITNYIRLLVLPVGQNIDHAYPVSRSILDARTILSLGFFSSLLVAASILYRRWRAGSFFILWFFIILLPSSSIVPLKDLLVEHRVYLPSVGIFFILASGMVWTYEMLRRRRSLLGVHCLLLIAVFGILWSATFSRNLLWNREIDVWIDSVEKSPLNARAHNNLGVSYTHKGMTDKAIEQYEITLRLQPGYGDAYLNLGVAYTDKGLHDQAIELLQTFIRSKPDNIEAYNSLGIAYSRKGLYDRAIEQYQIVLRLKPDYAEGHNNLGNCYLLLGNYKNALREYLKTLTLDPKNLEAYYNAGLSLKNLGMEDMAREFFVIFVKNSPKGYEKETRELALTYNIADSTPLPDAVSLIKKAVDSRK